MKKPISFTIELIHIEGPLKGTIQDFNEAEIVLGRHPSCHVSFPKDLVIISRRHATISREGNRFKLIDHSTNGTLLNGKPVQNEAYLRSGDVITLAQGGPKISFLLKKSENSKTLDIPLDASELKTMHAPPSKQVASPSMSQPLNPLHQEALLNQKDSTPSTSELSSHRKGDNRCAQTIIIQYDAQIKSFNNLPITIGSDLSCDFAIESHQCEPVKIELSCIDNQLIMRKLSGRESVTINNVPLVDVIFLRPKDIIDIGAGKIQIEFIGQGRFAQVLNPKEWSKNTNSNKLENNTNYHQDDNKPQKPSFLKKIFRS